MKAWRSPSRRWLISTSTAIRWGIRDNPVFSDLPLRKPVVRRSRARLRLSSFEEVFGPRAQIAHSRSARPFQQCLFFRRGLVNRRRGFFVDCHSLLLHLLARPCRKWALTLAGATPATQAQGRRERGSRGRLAAARRNDQFSFLIGTRSVSAPTHCPGLFVFWKNCGVKFVWQSTHA
jgi:hypothetical protein